MGYFFKTDYHSSRQEIHRSLWYSKFHYHAFNNAFCTVHVCQIIVYKLVRHYARGGTVKLYSDMFRWRPPPSSGKTILKPKKTQLLEGVYPVMRSPIYFAASFNTELVSVTIPTCVLAADLQTGRCLKNPVQRTHQIY